MIRFSDCKINLGLYVTARRPDGYHEVETVMYPVGWYDVIEVTPTPGTAPTLNVYGRSVDCPPEKNLVFKALHALESYIGRNLEVSVGLQKIIPDSAGLGGGSADAAFTLKALNDLFGLGLSQDILARIAAGIGADCPFFIYDRPALCTGIGTDLCHDIDIDLSPYSILVAKPRVAAVSTREAYAAITPCSGRIPLLEILRLPVKEWRGLLVNDFETGVFQRLPEVGALKARMYSAGALFSSMSGSGASVYGIFASAKMARHAADTMTDCDIHLSVPGAE
ncbi:MAG: 4-(cytidine 5'-diphospho)-2-C-methyl-D-erythritol kinase [Muribaculaceae bacterium]|nr:4-(cytidine 5'-diphospho)-2-C-methyl-D-erythritol kinase [Muribaculaceae bacterium]